MQSMIPQTVFFVAIGVLLFGLAAAAGQIQAPDDVAAAPNDAETTSSGLASKVIQA